MRVGLPSAVCAVVEHADAVDVEAAFVPIEGVARTFTSRPQVEADSTSAGVVHRSLDGRGAATHATVTALHAIATAIAFLDDAPVVGANGVVEGKLVEVASLEVDDGAGGSTAARDRVVFPGLGIPHGPTGAAHVEVLHTVDDLGQHIAEVGVTPDVDGFVDDEFVTRQIDSHSIVTLAERVDGLVASAVEGDGRLRVVHLFAFVEVGEAHHRALRAVGAVANDIHSDIGLHILVDARSAVGMPHNLAFAFFPRIVNGAVALVDSAHAPLVDAGLDIGPVDIEVSGIRHPNGGQELSVVAVVRTIVVAVGTIDVVVVQATAEFGSAAVATLHDDVRAVGAGVQGVASGLGIVRSIVGVGIARGVEASGSVSPLDGAGPAAIVALHEDHHVALAIPAEAFFVEGELHPAGGSVGRHATRVDLGHAGGKRRGGGSSGVFDVGHPDGDAVLGFIDAVGGIPAQARHRSAGHAGGGQLFSGVESGSDAIII